MSYYEAVYWWFWENRRKLSPLRRRVFLIWLRIMRLKGGNDMPLLDYTTKVPVSRTIAQIQAKLVEHGARAVMMEYGDDGRIKALAFNVKMPNGELPIRLPINTTSTLRVLQRQAADREIPAGYAKDEHAYRVAWRNIFHWVSAQMALLETEMVKMEEIFLGYVITPGGQTIYQVMANKGFLLGPREQT